MVIKDLVPVEWSNQRVLTTAQLAEFYGCSVENIRDNFRKNRERFVEDKHYFKLEGDKLRVFKRDMENFRFAQSHDTENFRFAQNLNVLYLWTKRGASRHCKMLGTERAWDVFEELEENYFSQKTSAPEIPAPAVKKFSRLFINVCVYVLLMSDDTVKVGYTKRFCKRISEIKSQFKLSVKGIHITPFMSCEKAQIVERCFKEIYSSQRVKGEIFSVDFDSACKTVNHFVELVSVPEIVSEIERAKNFWKWSTL